MWKLRHFFKRIKNLIRWAPIIWNDQDWDYFHIYNILKHKLVFMAEHMYNKGYHESSKQEGDRMMLCVRLINKVQNEYYMDELINDDEITIEKIRAGQKKHDKAKKLLFKILEQNIERWWD
jgi:hypothetical protein